MISTLIVVGIGVVALAADVILVALGLRSESTTVHLWSHHTAVVAWALGGLAGHMVHDLVKRLPLMPIPAHVGFFMSAVLVIAVDTTLRQHDLHLPAEVAVVIGYLAGGGLVGA